MYLDDVFMGIVDEGRLYFKVDDATVGGYRAFGMQAFAPAPDMVLKTYYEVPVDVLEDDAELRRWARAAREAALRNPSRGRRRRGRAGR